MVGSVFLEQNVLESTGEIRSRVNSANDHLERNVEVLCVAANGSLDLNIVSTYV